MLLISHIYTYKNLLLHTLLSLFITFILTILQLPIRFLEGLHTYILPENNTQSGVRAAIRRPNSNNDSSSIEEPKKRKSKEKFEFDENNAQIFRLQLVDDHLRSRIYYNQYRDALGFTLVALSSLLLHNFLSIEENETNVWINGSVIPVLLGFLAICKVLISIGKVTFERSASRKSEKQLSAILGVLGFGLVFMIVFVNANANANASSVFDFEFDSVDGFGKIWISISVGVLTGFLFMPGAKCARSFWLGTDQLRWNLSIIPSGGFGRTLLYGNILLSVFASLLWINPLVEIFVSQKSGVSLSRRLGVNENLIGNVGMERSDFVKFRIWCLMGSGVLQIMTLRPNLQMFLNEAVLSWYQRLHASKVPDLDFSRAKIFLHNYYLCFAVLQFLVPPALVLLFLGLSQFEGFDRVSAADAEEAEAWGIRLGLGATRDFGAKDVAVLTDCKNLAHLLQSGNILELTFGAVPLARDILQLSHSFGSCSFSFISRSCNLLAHELAQAGNTLAPFVSFVPAEINSLLEYWRNCNKI